MRSEDLELFFSFFSFSQFSKQELKWGIISETILSQISILCLLKLPTLLPSKKTLSEEVPSLSIFKSLNFSILNLFNSGFPDFPFVIQNSFLLKITNPPLIENPIKVSSIEIPFEWVNTQSLSLYSSPLIIHFFKFFLIVSLSIIDLCLLLFNKIFSISLVKSISHMI